MTEQVFQERGMYYRIGGNPTASRTIVLIHGLSGSTSAWNEFEDLVDDYEVKSGVTVTALRQYGESVAQRKRLLNYVDELIKE